MFVNPRSIFFTHRLIIPKFLIFFRCLNDMPCLIFFKQVMSYTQVALMSSECFMFLIGYKSRMFVNDTSRLCSMFLSGVKSLIKVSRRLKLYLTFFSYYISHIGLLDKSIECYTFFKYYMFVIPQFRNIKSCVMFYNLLICYLSHCLLYIIIPWVVFLTTSSNYSGVSTSIYYAYTLLSPMLSTNYIKFSFI
jgi:hypothetical protein